MANFYQILRRIMFKLASIDTMIVTTLIFTSFLSLLRDILGYFWAHFGVCFSFFENCLIFSHEILYICFWYYSDGHYTKNNFSCDVILCWGLFWHILGPFLCVIFYFLRTVFSWNFLQIFKNFIDPFYGLSSTVSKLQSHYGQAVYLLPQVLRRAGLSITLLGHPLLGYFGVF